MLSKCVVDFIVPFCVFQGPLNFARDHKTQKRLDLALTKWSLSSKVDRDIDTTLLFKTTHGLRFTLTDGLEHGIAG
jgi:hypothetical protein